MMPESVECYSGVEYPERPTAVAYQGRRLEIAQVIQAWRIPEGKRFRVQTEDMQVFELVYEEYEGDWLITLIR
jgi:hypothetical protein